MNAVSYVDELVREYLIFRGFTDALRQFDADKRNDKSKGFVVDKIIEQFETYVQQFDLASILRLWEYLDQRFFCRLDASFAPATMRLEVSLKRHYLIQCIQHGRQDRVIAFFEQFGSELYNTRGEWREWFALPYLKSPETDPAFEGFFTRQWVESFSTSLSNFLNAIFQNMPLPTILNYNTERVRRHAMEQELDALRSEVARLQDQLDMANGENDALKKKSRVGQLAGSEGSRSDRSGATTPTALGPATPLSTPGGSGGTASIAIAERPTVDSPARALAKDAVPASSGNPLGAATTTTATDKDKGKATTPAATTPQAAAQPAKVEPKAAPVAKPAPAPQQRRKIFGLGGSDPAPVGAAATSTSGAPAATGRPPAGSVSASDAAAATAVTEGPPRVQVSEAAVPDPDEEEMFIVLSTETFNGHTAPITACRFSRDGEVLASAATDGHVRLWTHQNAESAKAGQIKFPSEILAIDYVPRNDKLLLCGSVDGHIRIWDTASRNVVADIQTNAQYPRVGALCTSPTDAVFAAILGQSSVEGRLSIYNLRSQALITSLTTPGAGSPAAIAYRDDGAILAVGGHDGFIRLYDATSLTATMTWQAHTGPVECVRYLGSSNTLLSVGADGTVLSWSTLKLGSPTFAYAGETTPSKLERRGVTMATTEDGQFFVVGSTQEPVARIYQAGRVRPVQLLQGHSGPIVGVDWHSESNSLATVSADRTAMVSKLFTAEGT